MAPSPALAHGIGGASAPGIPGWLFAWGAALALVLSFAALGAFWRTPQLEHAAERRLARVPKLLDPLCGAIGLALFAGLIYAGLFGAQESFDNILPTWVFVVFWVAIPVASAFAGDVFRAFNPWLALARAIAFATRNASLPEPLKYPERLGQWPAAATILVFGWLELAFSGRDDPATLATLALGYALLQLLAMSLFGSEQWRRNGDGFAVYFGLFAKLAPLAWHDGALWRRRPLAGAAALVPTAGTVALVCVGLGTTTFDGLSGGPVWLAIVPQLQQAAQDLGLNASDALELASTVGLLACVAFIAAAYRLGINGMRVSKRDEPTDVLAARFVHSLLPIALAYVVAHYATLLLFQGQAVVALASDPLGDGANWLGTAELSVNYTILSATAIWVIQVVAVVAGHVAGLALAHDRALVSARNAAAAARTQRTMLTIMVALTSLALWLISSANQ